MNFKNIIHIILLLNLASPLHCITNDGLFLLTFKQYILNDPLNALEDWQYNDTTPCSWNGVICIQFEDNTNSTYNSTTDDDNQQQQQLMMMSIVSTSRVISLILPNCKLLGSIPAELGLIQHLQHIDLSGNQLNGTLPATLFNTTELRTLSLADNELTGELPDFYGEFTALKELNLSDNAFTGTLPVNLTLVSTLTSLSLANNYISGELPAGGFQRLEFLDLSSNLINGSIPADIVGDQKMIRFLNLSYNKFSGKIPAELGIRIARNATIDLSFNNLTGEIPKNGTFIGQKATAFSGNQGLCGLPLKSLCTIPSSLLLSNSSNDAALEAKSPPAFAAIPKDSEGRGGSTNTDIDNENNSLRPAAIIAITVGDMVGVGVLFALFLYVYQVKKKRVEKMKQKEKQIVVSGVKKKNNVIQKSPGSIEFHKIDVFLCCLGNGRGYGDDTEETSASSSETEVEKREIKKVVEIDMKCDLEQTSGDTALVTVDSESVLEIETLLKASAYILGATGSSIVYKAVLADGTALSVRRIGESNVVDKMKDFEVQVRSIAKFRHPNLLRLRGFYWGPDEKLLIHDYAPNGSLGNIAFGKKFGASSLHLSWEMRLRIVRGIARGLVYLHDKKSVHGNLKPNNILLDVDMEPKIGDFGLDKLVSNNNVNRKLSTLGKQFGSKRSMRTSISLPDLSQVAAGAIACGSSSVSPYKAPECMKNQKPNAKWDVYSFGMILLELISGRIFSAVELCQWNSGFVVEERNRIARMSDQAIRGEIEGKEEVVLSCFRLGFACCAMAPQRRPSMKEALQLLEKITPTSSSSC